VLRSDDLDQRVSKRTRGGGGGESRRRRRREKTGALAK
jgi:hypothetical protein